CSRCAPATCPSSWKTGRSSAASSTSAWPAARQCSTAPAPARTTRRRGSSFPSTSSWTSSRLFLSGARRGRSARAARRSGLLLTVVVVRLPAEDEAAQKAAHSLRAAQWLNGGAQRPVGGDLHAVHHRVHPRRRLREAVLAQQP